jgi:hypothetical protein
MGCDRVTRETGRREPAERATLDGTEDRERQAHIRYNALKRGLLAQAALLRGEDRKLFRRLAEELHAQL